MTSVYLASDLGFSAVGAAYREELHHGLAALGVQVYDPWDIELGYGPLAADQALKLGALNLALIDRAKRVLALLDGSDPDSGVCIEVGWAHAKGYRVDGLRTDIRLSGENTEHPCNLQVCHAIHDSGGRFITDIEQLPLLFPNAMADAA